MAQRKAKSNLASVHEKIVNFNKKDLNTENLKSYSWESFSEIDLKFEAYSTDATNVIISSGFSHFEINDCVVKPITLDNHQLFILRLIS